MLDRNFAHQAIQYPYLPPHIVEPKEIKKLYMVQLPMTSELAPGRVSIGSDERQQRPWPYRPT